MDRILQYLRMKTEDKDQETTKARDNIPAGPLKARAVVEAIHSESGNADESKATVATCGEVTLGHEQYLRLTIELPTTETLDDENSSGFTHIIVVADRSGSMAGSPWNQVKDAIKQIVGDCYDSDNRHVTVIIYNHAAKVGQFTQQNYKEIIDALKCSGMTSFSAAFDAVSGSLTNFVGSKRVTQTVIAFMTDGQDTKCGQKDELAMAVQTWKAKLARRDHPVVVHSIGFSRDHDYDFMCKLTEAGTEPGMYRYCQPDDGPDALRMKLGELFQYISSGETEVDVEISLGGDDKMVWMGDLTGTAVVKNPIRRIKSDEETEEAAACALPTNESLVIVAESWVYIADPSKVPDVGAVVHFPNGSNDIVQVRCEIDGVEQHIVKDDKDKVMWSVKILSRNTDVLTTKVGDTIKTGRGDITKLSARLKKLQERISKTKVYGRGITKEFRMAILDMIKEIQAKVDMMHKILAEYTRDKTSSVELLARANDLRYAAQFSKGRRQRLMDMRASRNLGQAQKAQQALDSIVINQKELDKLSQEALDFFFCVLSQSNIKETLLDLDEKTDAIGFGLAVMRPEHVLDEPTGIWIYQISGTLVSRSAMMNAVQHRINVDGHLDAHGGFNFGENNRMGVATVGTSREPINSWLPLYVCDQHWQRVKTLMRPILGYFCTLDDLGYDYKQVDVMYMVLGSMIGQINPQHCGEHQLRLLIAFHRTCYALRKDFELNTQMIELVRNFIKSGEGRTRDVVPSLYALIGYVVSLPAYALKTLFPANLPDGSHDMSTFWLAFIAENLRRAARNQFRETSDSVILGVIDTILHGNQDDKEIVGNALQILLDWKPEEGATAPEAFDASGGVEVIPVEHRHEVKVDKAMALWAQAACGHITNKNRMHAVSAAKKVVNQWVEAGKAEVKKNKTKEAEHDDKKFDVTTVNKSSVEALVKILKRLIGVMYPELNGIAGCISYLDFWINEQPDFAELDANSGLVPDHWIEKLRKAVRRVYSCMDDTVRDQQREATQGKDTKETVNIVVSDVELTAEAEQIHNERELDEGDIYTANAAVQNAVSDGDIEYKSEDDDDFGYSDDDYYDDDDDSVATTRRSANRHKKRKVILSNLNLPGVLRYVTSSCGRSEDILTLLRGAVCQALLYNNNTKARNAAKEGTMKDMAQGTCSAADTLRSMEDFLQEKRDDYVAKLEERATWQRANFCMMHSTESWAFIGYLMNTYTDRGEGFAELVEVLTDPETNKRKIPIIADKLRILVKGQYKGYSVLANGNMWLPEKKTGQKMAEAMGEEEWEALEMEVRSNVAIHVYRESDIPNRHGHCNSNPYIPNALRLKLGMPLMIEKQPGKKSSRLRAVVNKW